MWSRFTVVVRQLPHWQVKLRLLVLLRPTWRSQTWSWLMFSVCVTIECEGHVDLHKAAPLKADARRKPATGRQASRCQSLQQTQEWARSVVWECPWAAAGGWWPQRAPVLVVLRCSCLAAEMRFGSVVKTR